MKLSTIGSPKTASTLAEFVALVKIDRLKAYFLRMRESLRVCVTDHYDGSPENARRGRRREPYRASTCDIDRRTYSDFRGDRAVKSRWQDVGQHRQVTNLCQGLFAVREL
jgi:hypothetical protein